MKYNKIKTIIVIFILTIGFFAVVVEPALSFDPPPPPPPDEYIVEVTGYWCWVEHKFGPDWNTGKYAIYYNGTRIKSANMGVGLSGNRIPFTYRFSTTEAIDTILIRTLRRAKRCYYGNHYFGYFSVTEGRVRITRLGTVVYDQEGISHSPNLLPIIIPLPPTPIQMVTDFLGNLTPAVNLVVDTVGTTLNLFMQPPLILFVGLGLVGAALAYGKKLLKFGK